MRIPAVNITSFFSFSRAAEAGAQIVAGARAAAGVVKRVVRPAGTTVAPAPASRQLVQKERALDKRPRPGLWENRAGKLYNKFELQDFGALVPSLHSRAPGAGFERIPSTHLKIKPCPFRYNRRVGPQGQKYDIVPIGLKLTRTVQGLKGPVICSTVLLGNKIRWQIRRHGSATLYNSTDGPHMAVQRFKTSEMALQAAAAETSTAGATSRRAKRCKVAPAAAPKVVLVGPGRVSGTAQGQAGG